MTFHGITEKQFLVNLYFPFDFISKHFIIKDMIADSLIAQIKA